MTELAEFVYDGITFAGFSASSAIVAGVPQAMIDAAVAKARREKIKAECRRRIYGVANAETQMNINGAAAVIGAKAASQRSAAETALLSAQSAGVQWITAMRAAVESLSADNGADYLAETAWPECPAEVVALAAEY